jgi:quercetin dioxygenase-like cupin family protein
MTFFHRYSPGVLEWLVHAGTGRRCLRLAALASIALSAGAGGAAPSDAEVHALLSRDLIGLSGKEVVMETVIYAPGGKSPPHRHNAQVFVYGLEGSVRMQVQGSPAVTLGPGGTFYEGPDDVHVVSENASSTQPAKFLVVMVKDKAAHTDRQPPATAR